MKYLIALIGIIMISKFSMSQNVSIDDTLGIDKAIVEYLKDTSEVIDGVIPNTVDHVDRMGEFNRGMPIARIFDVQKETDSLRSEKVVFKEFHYSASSMADDDWYHFDFPNEVSCHEIKADFYEDDCKKVPFVKYFWEFEENTPGNIYVIVLTGHDNCYW